VLSQNNILILAIYTGADIANFVHDCIASAIAFAVAAIVTYILGVEKDDPALEKEIGKSEKAKEAELETAMEA
jgi:hypothetical protein